MRKILYGAIGGLIATCALCAPAMAISLEPCPDDEYKAECEEKRAELLRRQEAGEPIPRSVGGNTGVGPTFVAETDESRRSASLWVGKSLLMAGNNLTTTTSVKNGLLLVAGNSLQLEGESEYGFVAGNIIRFAGATQRDLYAAGNSITLADAAKIGRDVFVAGNELYVETDLTGDLSVTAERVVIKKGIAIDGNVNIDAENIEIGNDVTIGGKLIYNDSAHINDLANVSYGELETYHVEEISVEAGIVAAVYAKLFSIAGLFLAMVLIIAIYPRLHDKMQPESTANRFGVNLAIGCGTLVVVPMLVIVALLTIVAAPLGIIALIALLVAIYLAQGFAGFWLGHLILEKFFKLKSNAFVEALVGIIVLGALALVPFVGAVTGLLGMLLGLGLIISCIKPSKDDKGVKKLTKNTKSTKKATRK